MTLLIPEDMYILITPYGIIGKVICGAIARSVIFRNRWLIDAENEYDAETISFLFKSMEVMYEVWGNEIKLKSRITMKRYIRLKILILEKMESLNPQSD